MMSTHSGHWARHAPAVVLLLVVVGTIVIAAPGEKVDPLLWNEIGIAGEARFLVYLHEKADLNAAALASDWNRRGQIVYYALRDMAERSQTPLLKILQEKSRERKARDVASYWICNALAVTGDEETLRALADRPEVERIAANRKIQVLDPLEITETSIAPAAVEWNIEKIRAHQVWKLYGITGRGVVIGSMDTGVDLSHPALQRQYRGWNGGQADHNYHWIDATPLAGRVPYDSAMHGTHTMGTILGDDGAGNKIGVAPGAQWIAALIIGRDLSMWVESAHKGFQWMLAPTDLDGRNPDPDKRPAVVNNSWGCRPGTTGCSESLYLEFWDDVNAWISAGILPEFSGGNSGPAARSMGWPADYPQAFATGATDRNDNIAGFSSRGPSLYDDSVKPNVSAPGARVRSSIPGSRYGSLDGTSMAGPHVVGLVALLLEANPGLSAGDLEMIIQNTALSLGTERPNNIFGWGRIDALSAVEAALLP